jgi:hypothetical protein
LGDCGRLLQNPQIFAQLRRGIGSPEMNCGPSDQMPPATAPSCFLNLNWDQSMAAAGTAGEHLDPALSSMVSSPASNSTAAAASDRLALHGISPQPQYGGTPLSSPPKLNLSMMGQFHHYPPPQVGGAGAAGLPILENPMGHLDQFLADPGFAERAARFSSFDGRTGGGGYGGAVAGQFGLPDAGPVGALKELDLGNGRDESSVSDPASASPEMALKGPSDGNARKRKTSGKGKGKDGPVSTSAKDPTKVPAQFRSVCRSKSTRAVPSWNKRFHFLVCVSQDESSGKRCKSGDESNGAEENSAKGKAAQSSSENGGKKHGKDSTSKLLEGPKDYIHVRVRRGEATDSHSLAERVQFLRISIALFLQSCMGFAVCLCSVFSC